ncbi:hypothetical protein [uncultured Microbulbifer sp.]|uniref:hypothetical protein n=1 Tax=uncultured Microbulbifer sp. TaxID=348147 RepID=UPI002633D109|nr:hypothetical protein [uncultured Microbulbifer sp.]
MKNFMTVAAFTVGVLGGILVGIFHDQFSSTKQVVLSKDLVTDDGRVLPAGTVLRYVSHAPEGYIQADLAIAIEGEAISGIKVESNEKANVRNQYFYSGTK